MRVDFFMKSRFLWFSIIGVIGFLISLFIIIGISNDVSHLSKVKHSSNLSEKVRYYDEVLTMSARMASMNNSKHWVDRYYKNVQKLDDVIKELKEIVPSLKLKLQNIEDANIKLIKLEERSMNYALSSKLEKAKELLFSKEYENLKKLYSTSLNDSLMVIENNNKNLEDKIYKSIVFSSSIMVFMIFAFLVFIYFILNYLVKQNMDLENLKLGLEEQVKEQVQNARKKDLVLVEQSKLASLGEMLENIAHQWRQPLSSITSASSSIKIRKELGVLDDEELYKTLDAVIKSANHLSETIEVFRGFYKSGEEESFFVDSLFGKVKTLLASKFKTREVELVLDISDEMILAKENEIVQVVMNIFSNSLDEFILRDVSKRVILVNTEVQNKELKIEIKDSAGGIPKENLSKIFEHKFTTKEDTTGTGIGLYMCKLIVEKSKGSINVENSEFEYKNENYKGANFIIKLPLG